MCEFCHFNEEDKKIITYGYESRCAEEKFSYNHNYFVLGKTNDDEVWLVCAIGSAPNMPILNCSHITINYCPMCGRKF